MDTLQTKIIFNPQVRPTFTFGLLYKKILKLIFRLIIIFVIMGFCVITSVSIIYFNINKNLPNPTMQAMLSAPQSTRILDRNGVLLYEVHGDIKRTSVPLAEIPEFVRNATVAIEDKNFFKHHGFDPTAVFRAMIVNYRNHEISQGASTISQQLARISFLNNEKTLTRKIKELILSLKIEYKFSKDEILELYLNNIPYGSNAYGIEAASEIYFDKHARDLSLLEAAYLAALPKAPTDYSPFGQNPEALDQRALAVIQKMQELDFISPKEANESIKQWPIEFKRVPTVINAPHFVFYIIDYLKNVYGEKKLSEGGLTVYTSLDLTLQKKAEQIVSEWGEKNEEKFQATNAALVGLDPRSGKILAMVGSRDYFRSGDGAFNVALSPRQPGSSFKPYVYATAFANGQNPATMIIDTKTDFASYNNGVSYIPSNYTGRYYGVVSIRQALAGSLNISAVKTLVRTGIDKSIDTAEKLGISTLKKRERFGPAIVLGGAEVKLLEHTAAYGAFGVGGVKQELAPILRIVDAQKNIIYEHSKNNAIQAIDPQVAYLINDILSDVNARKFIFGRGLNLQIPNRSVAVKTGTSQEFRDAWTIGYTPSLVVGVWVGNNDNSPMKKGADGSVVAAPIWKEFMTVALADQPVENFNRPEGIVVLLVDSVSGKLPTEYTPRTKKEVFASFNVPTEKDDIHLAPIISSSSEQVMVMTDKKY